MHVVAAVGFPAALMVKSVASRVGGGELLILQQRTSASNLSASLLAGTRLSVLVDGVRNRPFSAQAGRLYVATYLNDATIDPFQVPIPCFHLRLYERLFSYSGVINFVLYSDIC